MPKGSSNSAGTGKDLNLDHLKNKGKGDDQGKRFVFRTFAKRVANVNIDVHHSLVGDEADERELSGVDALAAVPLAHKTTEKWVELNCTAGWKAFQKEVSPLLLSVPLMLHKRAELFACVRKHLSAAPAISLKPILEVTAAIAADLRQEFYGEFPALLRTLATLLSPSDVEMLEDTFSTLCYLFKYLLRQLLDDLPAAFEAYRPLLAHDRAHVREFAAESFSYLLRRLPVGRLPSVLTSAIVPHIGVRGVALDRGIAQLLFHVTVGLGHAFHSKAPHLLKSVLAILHPAFSPSACRAKLARPSDGDGDVPMDAPADGGVEDDDAASHNHLVVVVAESLHLMSEHTRRQHAEVLWTPLLGACKEALAVWSRRLQRTHGEAEGEEADDGNAAKRASRLAAASAHARALLQLLCQWVGERRGSRVPEGGKLALVTMLCDVTDAPTLAAAASVEEGAGESAGVLHELLQTLAAALLTRCPQPVEEAAVQMRATPAITTILSCTPLAPPVCGLAAIRFGLALVTWKHFAARVLDLMLTACNGAARLHPLDVTAALYSIVHTDPTLMLALAPPSKKANAACVDVLCDAVEGLRPPTTVSKKKSAAAATAAAPSVPSGWAALQVIHRCEGIGARARARLGAALTALVNSSPAALAAHAAAPQSVGMTLHAAAIEAYMALARDGTPTDADALKPAAAIEPALRALTQTPPPDAKAFGGDDAATHKWASPALLHACAKLVNALDDGAAMPDEALLELVRHQVHCDLSDAAADVRGAALELCQSLHSRTWLTVTPDGVKADDELTGKI